MATIATSLLSKIRLNDGHMMPMFGLGLFQVNDACSTVLSAIQAGYRLIDCAEYYPTEADVGKAIKTCGVPRQELYVTNKLWDNGVDICKAHFKASLEKMQLDYIDLYFIHSPLGGNNVVTYETMLDFQKQGLIRSVGVSNFGVHHLKALKATGLPLPAVNQIELHPWQQKTDIVKYCREEGITVMGYSPLSKGRHFTDQPIVDMASRYDRTPAQILLRWSVQNGYVTIPKSSNPKRMVENADVFSWSLKRDDMQILNGMPDICCSWNPCESPWEG